MEIDGSSLVNQQQLFVSAYGRLRTVEPSIDGGLWLTTSNGGDKDNQANNSNTEIFKVTLGSSQQPADVLDADKTYTVMNRKTQRLLNVDNGSSAAGANVSTQPSNDEKWQQWRVTKDGSAYVFLADHSGQALNIEGARNANQRPYQNNPSAQWRLEPTGDGYFILISENGGEALDEEESSNNVTDYPRHGRQNQQWLFTEVD
jgi:hypothetical protein